MKSKLRVLMVEAILLTPLFTSLPGCNQPDNPKMAEAPPPPAPTKEELALPKGEMARKRITEPFRNIRRPLTRTVDPAVHSPDRLDGPRILA